MKSCRATVAACAFLLFASACAPTRPALKAVPLPPERLAQRGFSFVPLNEAGWLIVGRRWQHVILAKYGDNPDETFVIRASLEYLPDFQSRDDFLAYLKKWNAEESQVGRFRQLSQTVERDKAKGESCARAHTVTEDHGATKRSGQPGYLILETTTLFCAHPNNKKVGVMIGYSERYYPGQKDPKFDEKAAKVLGSVEFTDLPAPSFGGARE